jgi:hypothetical protein
MSPSLLSKRLKELEEAGVIHTKPAAPGTVDYCLTQAGEDLRPVVMALGIWGQRWIESDLSLNNLDPSLLMWDMRRHLDPTPLPEKRCTILFQYPELVANCQNWWLIISKEGVDLCSVDPGHEIDLYVKADLRSMTKIWMGLSTVARELSAGKIELTGDRAISRSMQKWLGLSPFAKERPRIAA